MTEAEIEALEPDVRAAELERAYHRMYHAGAHYVVDSIGDALPLVDEINARLARGERP